MGNKAKDLLKIVGLPLIFLAIFLSLWAVWKLLDLPPKDELIEITRRYFDLYGYWIVFASAIIEGMLLVGLYYPGSLVILLGVIFAGKNIPEVIWVVTLVTIGLFLVAGTNRKCADAINKIWIERNILELLASKPCGTDFNCRRHPAIFVQEVYALFRDRSDIVGYLLGGIGVLFGRSGIDSGWNTICHSHHYCLDCISVDV